MAQVGMTVNFKTAMDITPVKNGLAEINKTVAQSPIDLKIKDTGIKTGMSKKESDAFYKEIRSGAVELEKLTIQYKMFQNVAGGPAFKVATQAIKETKDATGHLSKEMRDLNVQKIKMYEADARYKQVGMDQVVLNAGAAARKTTSDFNKMKLSLDANELSAKKFLEKSKNMSGQQVNDTKKVAEELLKQKKAFDLAFSTGNVNAMQTAAQKVRDLNKEMQILRSGTDRGANAIQGWADRIGNAIKQTVAYGLSIQLVRKAQQLLNDAIKYSIELNTEMVKIQVLQAEGAQSPEEIRALAESYNKLGQAMGTSTLDIAKGSVEWLRQGRTVEETQKLLISTLQLSKLGAMDAADATNYLTAITNAFKLSADETATVVDKLIAVDNIAATSAGELATAMRYTSESAQLAGVSMEQLISYIGTVSSVTRQNAEMIGQAFKTMFARMTLMSGGGEDEFGMTISKVEKSLSAIGIAVRDTNDELLPMGDILEAVAGKWQGLTDRQRTDIAVAVAGVRQKEAFLVLMNNMDKAITYQTAQLNANGLAQERYGIYLESVQAKQGQFNAKLEELKSTIVSEDIVKGFYDIANSFLDMVNNAGGLVPILTTILGLFIAIKGVEIQSAIMGAISAIGGLITKLTAAGAAATTASGGMALFSSALGPIGLAITAIGLVITGYNLYMADHKKKYDEAATAVQDYIDKVNNIPNVTKSAETALNGINELLQKQKEEGLKSEELDKLKTLYAELYELAPNLQWSFPQGNPVLEIIPSVEELNQKIIENTYLNEKSIEAFSTNLEGIGKTYKENSDSIKSATFELGLLQQAQHMSKLEFDAFYYDLQNKSLSEKLAMENYDAAGYKAALNIMKPIYNNLVNIAPEQLGSAIEGAMIQVGANISSKTRANSSVSEGWRQMFAGALVSTDPVIKNWIEVEVPALIANDPVLGPAIGEALRKAIEDNLPKQLTIPGLSPMDLIQGEPEGPKQENKDLQRGNEIYRQKIKLLGIVKKEYKSIQDVIGDTTKNEEDLRAVTQQYVDSLVEAGKDVSITDFMTGGEIDTSKIEDYNNELLNTEDLMFELYNISPQLWQLVTDATADAKNELLGVADALVRVQLATGQTYDITASQSQEFVNWLSASMFNLVENANQGIMITTTQGKQVIVYSANDIMTLMNNNELAIGSYIQQVIAMVGASASTMAANVQSILGGLAGSLLPGGTPFFMPPPMTGGGGGGGGGGGNPNQAAIDALDEEIKKQREAIEALREKLRVYKEWIDSQKDALKRQKEEADFLEDMEKKYKKLNKVKARLALLALDDSEEAQREMLELQEEEAEQEEDIKQELEDRKYEIMIQALDDLLDAFEKATDDQIKIIEDVIKALEDQKEALSDVAGGGGGGGGYAGVGTAVTKFGQEAQQVLAFLHAKLGESHLDLGKTEQDLYDQAIAWLESGKSIKEVIRLMEEWIFELGMAKLAAEQAAEAAARLQAYQSQLQTQYGNYGSYTLPPGMKAVPVHSGGIVTEHGGRIATDELKDNEVFAKLLRGEYVATEGQMNNFMKNILPKIATNIAMNGNFPPALNGSGGAPNTNFEININVAGSLDKSVLPDIKKTMIKELNKILQMRGIKRSANNFTV